MMDSIEESSLQASPQGLEPTSSSSFSEPASLSLQSPPHTPADHKSGTTTDSVADLPHHRAKEQQQQQQQHQQHEQHEQHHHHHHHHQQKQQQQQQHQVEHQIDSTTEPSASFANSLPPTTLDTVPEQHQVEPTPSTAAAAAPTGGPYSPLVQPFHPVTVVDEQEDESDLPLPVSFDQGIEPAINGDNNGTFDAHHSQHHPSATASSRGSGNTTRVASMMSSMPPTPATTVRTSFLSNTESANSNVLEPEDGEESSLMYDSPVLSPSTPSFAPFGGLSNSSSTSQGRSMLIGKGEEELLNDIDGPTVSSSSASLPPPRSNRSDHHQLRERHHRGRTGHSGTPSRETTATENGRHRRRPEVAAADSARGHDDDLNNDTLSNMNSGGRRHARRHSGMSTSSSSSSINSSSSTGSSVRTTTSSSGDVMSSANGGQGGPSWESMGLGVPSVKTIVQIFVVSMLSLFVVSMVFAFSYVSTVADNTRGWWRDKHVGQRLRDGLREREWIVQKALEKMAGDEYAKVRKAKGNNNASTTAHAHAQPQQQPSSASSGQSQSGGNQGHHFRQQSGSTKASASPSSPPPQQPNGTASSSSSSDERKAPPGSRLSNNEWQELIRAATMNFLTRVGVPQPKAATGSSTSSSSRR